MELRDFVEAVTADEPPLTLTADDIVAAGRRVERRRRAGIASAGAAALVAVAVGGVFLLPSQTGRQGAAPLPSVAVTSKAAAVTWRTAEPFSFTFEAFDAGKFQVQDPSVTSTAYQMASVYAKGRTTNDKPSTPDAPDGDPNLFAYLTVYRPGAFDPSTIKNGRPLTVAGHKAVQATLPVGLNPARPIDPGNKELAWEYTDNAWAVVTSLSPDAADPSFADLAALVTGLKPSPPRPALLPFKVGYVPSGYRPVETGTHVLPGRDGIADARGGAYGGATFAEPAPATTGLGAPYGLIKGSFDISVAPSRSANQRAQAGKTTCSSALCNLWSADGKVQVQVSAQNTGMHLTTAELRKIAQSVTVADVNDEATWIPAAEALK
ncbi:hypothetical protein AB0J80_32115 [Actinoplanes sp. NPDC049548]|uniref:hypothetical protein n=1 Tax=Actinoplanes sp. NPDC049548 TaxID=3155152 RepID=UPI003417AE9D